MAVLRSAVVAAVAALAVAARPAHKRAAAKTAAAVPAAAATASCSLPNMRPPPAQRTFVSTAVDAEIASLVPKFKDFNLGTLFANTLPNALDTTVYSYTPSSAGTPDTFIVTGDIIAMWLRDSTNQVLPYLQFANQDAALKDMLVGLIGRQARSVLIDPYANAFQLNALQGQGPHADDQTYKTLYAGTTVNAYTPAIFERKYEVGGAGCKHSGQEGNEAHLPSAMIRTRQHAPPTHTSWHALVQVDSLANVLRLSALYYAATGDLTPFNGTWVSAVTTILATYRDQQQDTAQEDANGGPAYTFQRTTSEPSDSLEQGRGYPVKHTGMIKGAFRGSVSAGLARPSCRGRHAAAANSLLAFCCIFTSATCDLCCFCCRCWCRTTRASTRTTSPKTRSPVSRCGVLPPCCRPWGRRPSPRRLSPSRRTWRRASSPSAS